MSLQTTPHRAPTVKLSRGPRLGLPAIIGVLTVGVILMLLAFLTPAIRSGAHDLPLAVSGPDAAVTQVRAALTQRSPGAFELSSYASADELAATIHERRAIGGIALAADGVTVYTATAAGAPYAPLLKGLGAGLAASGQKVSYVEVAPLTADDPAGVGLSALGLPLIFGGMASAVLLATAFRSSSTQRVAGSLAFSLVAGLTATALLQFGFGAIAGTYPVTALVVSLGIASISLTVLGLESLLGIPGLALGAILMLFISNPLSGLAAGAAWLPQPWGEIGQFLPLGAAGTAIRSAAFFDGLGMTRALVVLACWTLAGLALTLMPSRRTTAATPQPA